MKQCCSQQVGGIKVHLQQEEEEVEALQLTKEVKVLDEDALQCR